MATTTDLFKKLDGIRVDAASEISPQDRHFCEMLQYCYERAAHKLKQVHALSAQIIQVLDLPETQEIIADGWCIESLVGDVREHAEKIQEEISNNRDRIFIDAIVNYFEREYHLEFEFELEQKNRRDDNPKKLDFCALPRKNGLLHWQDIVRVLLRKAGANGFGNAGAQRIIEQFRDFCVRHYDHAPQLISRLGPTTLKLVDFWALETDWGGRLCLSWSGGREKILKVLYAFQYFENGELSINAQATLLVEDMTKVRNGVNFLQAIEVPFSKVESIKFYQNRRFDIKFSSKENREAFIEKFNLGHLIEEQKNLK